MWVEFFTVDGCSLPSRGKKGGTDMWSDSSGHVALNGVTALVGFLLILIVVLGGFAVSSPDQGVGQVQAESEEGPYAVTVSEDRVAVENRHGDSYVYEQIVLYVTADGVNQQLELSEEQATDDDGDPIFESGESTVRQLKTSNRAGTSVSVSIVDASSSDILYSTTANVTAELNG